MKREHRRATRHGNPALRRAVPGLALLGLIACAPESYEGDPLTEPVSELEMPEIVPLQPLLAQIEDAPDADDPDPELRQRGEALREQLTSARSGTSAGRQSARPQQTEADADFEARSAELRQRAEAVRNAQE